MEKEVERKFLVEMPDFEELKVHEVIRIEQYYLMDTDLMELRVRKVKLKNAAKTLYSLDFKSKIPAGSRSFTRDELPIPIGEEQFEYLKTLLMPDRAPVVKTRYEYEHRGHFLNLVHLLEFDVFDKLENMCIMEVELKSENHHLWIPDFVKVIREVTNDKDYYSANIAKQLYEKEYVESNLVRIAI